MKRVHTGPDPVFAGFLKALLEERGIAAIVRNQYLSGAVGELPPTAVWPEVWVLDERDAPLAERLVAEVTAPPVQGEAWQCPRCGAPNDAEFGICWSCGEAL